MTTRRRVAVLASGGGSNLQALLDYLDARGEPRAADVVLVASDRSAAGALDRARRRGIETQVLDAEGRTSSLLPLLHRYGVDLVVLAGYLRFVPNDVTAAYRGAIVNVHPALLPSFGGPGMFGERVHAAVLASGARISGVTVHFVDERYDQGAIIAQWPVPVRSTDTPRALADRVLAVEHLLYPRVIEQLAAGVIRLLPDGRVEGWSIGHGLFGPADDPRAISRALDSNSATAE